MSVRKAKRKHLKWRRYSDRLPLGCWIPPGEGRAWWRHVMAVRRRRGDRGLVGVRLS